MMTSRYSCYVTAQARLFGGFHRDVGSRQQLIRHAVGLEAPVFVAVEWSSSLHAAFAATLTSVERELAACWAFLGPEDCRDLAEGLVWEVNTPLRLWPGAEIIWLEEGHQEVELRRRHGVDAATFARNCAESFARALCNPSDESRRTLKEFFDGTPPPPEPTSLAALVDRATTVLWSFQAPDTDQYDRDARWAELLIPRLRGLDGGWAAFTGGWVHANPADPKRLCQLLKSSDVPVTSFRLGPTIDSPT